MTLSQKDAVMI